MATTTMVHVRVDEQIKTQATETLAAMGLSVSDAVRENRETHRGKWVSLFPMPCAFF